MGNSWRSFFRRAAIAVGLIIVVNLVVVLFWAPEWFLYWQVPLSCAIFIGFLGITLFETLFNDRPR